MRVDGQEGSSNDVAGVDQRGDGPARAGEGTLVDDRIFRGCEIPAIVAGDVPAASGEPGAQPVGQPGSRAALFLQEPDVGIDRLEDSLKVRRSLKVEDARVLDVVGGEANGVDPWPIDIDGPGWGDLPCIDGVGEAARLVGKQISFAARAGDDDGNPPVIRVQGDRVPGYAELEDFRCDGGRAEDGDVGVPESAASVFVVPGS